MAKAINWPAPYRETILAEDTEQLRCAFRLGTIYFDGQYWTPDEEVDIRCNHLRVRRGVVRNELVKTTVGALSADILQHQKPDLQSVEAIKAFFKTHYDTDVTDDTELTVVFYQNLPLTPEHQDAPDPSGRFV